MNFKRFREIQTENAALCETKNRVYGDRSLKRFGALGIVVRMTDKVERLASMVVENHRPGRRAQRVTDSAIDAAKDLQNYATMLQMFLEGTFDEEVSDAVEQDSRRVGRRSNRRPARGKARR